MSKDKEVLAALEYHANGRPGKVEVIPTKPCITQRDLSLAYSPGVAHPCMEIANNPEDVFKYTMKGNLVAVVTNGSAVLGLGNIGPLASKPVMEGKGVLFKRFADIDVFDIEMNCGTVDEMVSAVQALEPTFGGINLEDIKAPECFEIEKQLREKMNIPVFHDDQHGTAIIASAGFLNAVEIIKKDMSKVKVVFSGAGAAAIACANLFFEIGVKKENLIMCDSKGVIYKGRKEGMNKYKEAFVNDTDRRSLADAMKDADAFIGCSAKGVLTKEMVKTMANDPIIFAMANPDPEILPEEVAEVRDDAIMATGRSDYPNQVNNVLGFPFIFRGALDVRATKINEEMKVAAVRAIAQLAKEDVPEEVKMAYGNIEFSFGREYLIPKPFDKRVLTKIAPAVAKAAMDTGVAQVKIDDLGVYAEQLQARLGSTASFMRRIRMQLKGKQKKKIVYPEGWNTRILKSISILNDQEQIEPILLGDKKSIHSKMDELNLSHLKELEIIEPETHSQFEEYYRQFYSERQRSGVSIMQAEDLMTINNYFATMMVKRGDADGMVTGTTKNYPDCLRPIMRVLGTNKTSKLAGIIILIFKKKVLFLADCTMQKDPNEKDLADIAINATNLYQKLLLRDPAIAFLSYSSFGSNQNSETIKIANAVKTVKEKFPDIMVDGEVQADIAVNNFIMQKLFEFSSLKKDADLLIFPNLMSSNISYKLLSQLGEATAIGPILVPMDFPINIVQRTSTVEEIVHMSQLTALISDEKKRR